MIGVEQLNVMELCADSDTEDRDTVLASVQLLDDASPDDISEGVVIEEDSNEVVIYEEDDDSFAGMQFVTEQLVTEQILNTKSSTVDCQYPVLLLMHNFVLSLCTKGDFDKDAKIYYVEKTFVLDQTCIITLRAKLLRSVL